MASSRYINTLCGVLERSTTSAPQILLAVGLSNSNIWMNLLMSMTASSPEALWLLLPGAGGVITLQSAPKGQHQSREMLRLIASYKSPRQLAVVAARACQPYMWHRLWQHRLLLRNSGRKREGHGDVRAIFAQRLL
jgi:hypothetical protein